MEPTSRGFFEVRDVFFRELVDMSKNLLNGGNKEKLGEVRETMLGILLHFGFLSQFFIILLKKKHNTTLLCKAELLLRV